MRDWCHSIDTENIHNNHLNRVTTSITIYCGSASTTHNPSKAQDIAKKIYADSGRCSSDYCRSHLYQFWKLHPDVRDVCCYTNTNYYLTLTQKLIDSDTNEMVKLADSLRETTAIDLRKELASSCSSADVFCHIKYALHIFDLAAKLPSTVSEETKKYKQAILVSIVILKKRNGYYSSLTISETDVIVECINTILKYMRDKETSKMKAFAAYLPPSNAYKSTTASCQNDNICIFMKIVIQLRSYIDEAELDYKPVDSTRGKRLILNTGTDYREFLRQKQLNRILTVLSEQGATSLQIANDLKQHVGTKFTELRSYFKKVETFNQQIADADIGYIKGRIKVYQERLDTVIGKLRSDMTSIIVTAIVGVSLNIAEKTVLLALDIAAAYNPIKAVFTSNNLQDVINAAADLANAIADAVKLGKVNSAYNELRTEITTLGEKLQKNDKFLKTVNDLIKQSDLTDRAVFEETKDKFLADYNAYDPLVKLSDITGVSSLWQNLIGAVCDVIGNIDSALGAVAKGVAYGLGLCESIPALVDEMTTIYEEIYEYQFDLMDSIAAYIRASVGLDAAKEISTEFEEVTKLNIDSGTTLTTLQMIGGLSFVTYQAHLLQTVHLYCNVLEYMEGGKKPTECKGVKTDIALLIANIEPTCISETYKYYFAPTQNSTNTDQAYVDITQLFSGFSVPFKIPNAQWLVDHDWIHEKEKDFALYVKKFDVFLPVKPEVPMEFYVTADPVLHNAVVPGSNSTKYIIVPHTHLIHEYSMGPPYLRCGVPKVQNPYTTCEQEDVSELCHFSDTPKWSLYPSIYSQWSLSVNVTTGQKKLTIPKPATNLSVIFGIQICKIAQYDYNRESHVQVQEKSYCCGDGQYRPNDTSSCIPCPADSSPSLAGYYCERND